MTVTHLHPEIVEVDYERLLLGACMTGRADIAAVNGIVTAESFYQPAHAAIWQAVLADFNDGLEPTFATVFNRMGKTAQRLPTGAGYLHTLVQDVPLATQAEYYAGQVSASAAKRKVADIGAAFQQIAASDLSAEDMLELAKQRIDELGQRRGQSTVMPAQIMPKVIDIAQNGGEEGTPTPWADLNRVLYGWFPGQLIVIGARPGVGKSIFGENAATDMAMRGQHVYFSSMEMSAVELLQRTTASLAKVNLQALRTGHVDERAWGLIGQQTMRISDLPLHINDRPSQSMADIRAGAHDVHRRFPLGLVVVDYLGLVKVRDRRIGRHLQIGEITRELKVLARELQVPVICLAQLRRPQNPKVPPTMDDLKESGDIEQDADVVVLLHWDQEQPTEIQAIIPKQRSGPNNVTVPLVRRGHYARFDNLG